MHQPLYAFVCRQYVYFCELSHLFLHVRQSNRLELLMIQSNFHGCDGRLRYRLALGVQEYFFDVQSELSCLFLRQVSRRACIVHDCFIGIASSVFVRGNCVDCLVDNQPPF